MCHNDDPERPIEVQQINYLSNIVEQDHRAIKLMLNFKSFRSAGKVWAGIELMYMIRKGQMMIVEVWEEIKCLLQINFYALAG
jgi:transposase-like protein